MARAERARNPGQPIPHFASLHGSYAAGSAAPAMPDFDALRSEPVIHAEAQQVRGQPVVGAGQNVALIAEIEIKIFDLGRPMRREADFDAAARGPARVRVLLGQAREREPASAVCKPARCIDQDIAERHSGPAAHGTEPGIGELVWREGSVGAGQLQIGLGRTNWPVCQLYPPWMPPSTPLGLSGKLSTLPS